MFTMTKHDYLHLPAILIDSIRINDNFLAEYKAKLKEKDVPPY